jgi:hypothetical protein
MFNPVNNSVIDKGRLDIHDKNQQNRKQRYKIRYDVEDYYKDKNLEKDVKKDNALESKLSYMRYKTVDNRGYDIVNFGNKYEHYKNSLNLKNEKGEWDVIVSKAGGKLYI